MVDPQKLTFDLSKRWEEKSCTPAAQAAIACLFARPWQRAQCHLAVLPMMPSVCARYWWSPAVTWTQSREATHYLHVALPVHATAISMPWIRAPRLCHEVSRIHNRCYWHCHDIRCASTGEEQSQIKTKIITLSVANAFVGDQRCCQSVAASHRSR